MDSSASHNSTARPRGEPPTLSTQFLNGVRMMDPAGWSRLVGTFGPVVYRWCRASGVPESDSPDVVQEVFASVARGIGEFEREKTEGSFRSWLATITRNKVRDYYRTKAKQQQAVGGTQALELLQQQAAACDTTICPDSIESPLIRAALEAVRAEFEPATWEAFWRNAIDNVPAAEVATALGVSIDSVYQSKSRVLRRLRAQLSWLPK